MAVKNLIKIRRKKKTTGLPPGSVIYTGKKTDIDIHLNYVEFDEHEYHERTRKKKEEVKLSPADENKVQWYDIRGLHDTHLINEIGNIFHIHPMVSEDAVDYYQRPKYTEYENGHFIHIKSFEYNTGDQTFSSQAISVFFGKAFVVTYQEHDDDIFASIRQRIKESKGRIRFRNADYLAYAIIDYIIDTYYEVIDEMEQRIEELEEDISIDADMVEKAQIYELKKKLTRFRKHVAPLREAVNLFSRSESELIAENNKIYIRDAYDHLVQILDSIDNHRDILSSLQDLYLSEISMKMNKVMQFLTIITSIFVPLSFLAGLYGMNFEYMPELKFRYAYFILIAVMWVVALSMILVFKRKKWF